MPQDSILGPLLFNVFITDIFLFNQEGSLCNFANGNTISISAENDHDHRLVKVINKCIERSNSNHMTANASKFQSLIVGKNHSNIKEFHLKNEFKVNINNQAALLGIHNLS